MAYQAEVATPPVGQAAVASVLSVFTSYDRTMTVYPRLPPNVKAASLSTGRSYHPAPTTKQRQIMAYYSRPNNRQTITDLDTALERIHQLEDEQGLGFRTHPRHNFTGMEDAMLGVLVSSRDVVSRDKMFNVMYGMHDDPPEPKIFDVMMCKIRRKLRTHGIQVMTVWGRGWYLEPEDRDRINALRFVIEAA